MLIKTASGASFKWFPGHMPYLPYQTRQKQKFLQEMGGIISTKGKHSGKVEQNIYSQICISKPLKGT
jgi:hypothetical protein